MLAMALLSVFIIEISLFYFTGASMTSTSLYNVLTAPSTLLTSDFWTLGIIIIISLSAFAAFTPGFIFQSNQWAMFALGVGQLIAYVSVIVQLWGVLDGALVGHLTSGGSTLIVSIIIAPLIIVYTTAMIEWTRFNQ